MKRLCIAFALVILAGRVNAQDNVRYVTNNVLALSASANPLSYYRDFDIRLKVWARRGAGVQNLTDTFVRWVIYDKRDMQLSAAAEGYIIGDPTNGMVTASLSMQDLEPGAYQGVMTAYDVLNSNKVADLSLNDITLSDWCEDCPSAGGASVSVSVTTTANVTVASSGTGNVVTGLTANGSVVTEHRGTVAGVSGGGLTIYGAASNTFGVATSLQFSSRFSLSGTTNGGVLVDYTTPILPDWSTGTNVVSYGSIGTQLVTFAAGVSNASLEMWSGASCSSASGGSGSYGKLYLRGDLESIQLMLYIPQGGEGTQLAPPHTGFVYQTSSAFPGGGRGVGYVAGASFSSVPSGSGGYAAAFIIDGSGTNLAMIVPGGAGSATLSTTSLGGDGGNELSGEDASGVSGGLGGYGATSSSNGYYFTLGNLLATGRPPDRFAGGDASLTNLPTSHLAAGGGSPGWFSGSGGFIISANGRSGGGSAVGWINRTNAYVLAGDIFGGESGVPVGIDSRGYVAGWAYPLATPATYPLTSRAGQGGAVVKW
jgi:hypothetical protein